MAQTANFIWPQGEDLDIKLIYKEGPVGSEIVVDLSSGYSLRMDIAVPATKERVYTFNTAAIADVDPIASGSQPDNVIEGVLSSGAGATPNITISIPRSLTLPATGAVYLKMTDVSPVLVFSYDVFLRHIASDKQTKILQGTITVEESQTLWL
jgi:hypothetical protein